MSFPSPTSGGEPLGRQARDENGKKKSGQKKPRQEKPARRPEPMVSQLDARAAGIPGDRAIPARGAGWMHRTDSLYYTGQVVYQYGFVLGILPDVLRAPSQPVWAGVGVLQISHERKKVDDRRSIVRSSSEVAVIHSCRIAGNIGGKSNTGRAITSTRAIYLRKQICIFRTRRYARRKQPRAPSTEPGTGR